MIIVKIIGGLGNQMFQYAFGVYLKELGYNIRYDLSNFKCYNLWDYKLESLFDLKVERPPYIVEQFFSSCQNQKIHNGIKYLTSLTGTYLQEADFSLTQLKKNRLTYLDGYWQNAHLINEIKTNLCATFNLKPKLSIGAMDIIAKTRMHNTVAIHIRRGDFVSNKKNLAKLGICDLSYYEKAIDELSTRTKPSRYFIFSDDIKWVQKEFPSHLKEHFSYIEGLEDFEDFEIMKSCNHHIIANSSFSWWAAKLNTSKNQVVIAPAIFEIDSRPNAIDPKWVKI